MLLKLAWRNIWRNKRRSLITMASIAFAVIFALLTRTMQLGMYDHMIESVVGMYSGYVQVHSQGYWEEKSLDNSYAHDNTLMSKVSQAEGVRLAVPRLESFALASSGEKTRGTAVIGVDPELETAMTGLEERVVAGRWLRPQDEGIVISEGLGTYMKLNVGDTLVLLGQGYQGMTAAGKYPIIGWVKYGSPVLNQGMVMLPMPLAEQMFGAEERRTSLALMMDDRHQSEAVRDRVLALLPEGYEVMDWKEMMPELIQSIQADSGGGIIMLMILYMVVAFGIFGTVIMMTAERRYEMGVMVSVGMKRQQLMAVMALEMALMGFIGVLIGTVVIYPLAYYIHLNPIPITGESAEAYLEYGFEPILKTSVDLGIFLRHGLVVLGIALATTLYPSIIIARLHPVKAMKR
ncbi:MAG: ABC transporter permease [Cytophagales bacterium]|nr:ABC transporter permease [Cytophagales bacterium]